PSRIGPAWARRTRRSHRSSWRCWTCNAVPPHRLSRLHTAVAPAAAAEALVGILRRGLSRAQPHPPARPGGRRAVPRPRLAGHPRPRLPPLAALRIARCRGGSRDGHDALHDDPIPRPPELRARGLAYHGADLHGVRSDRDFRGVAVGAVAPLLPPRTPRRAGPR